MSVLSRSPVCRSSINHVMTRSHQTGLAFIAAFKVVKGLLLLLAGLGLLEFVHAEIATLFSLLIEALHLNADSRILHVLILKVDALQPHSVFVMEGHQSELCRIIAY